MKKTDNHNLSEKLELRRRLCRELTAPLQVLDLFSGEGRIWEALGKEFQIAGYTPVDVKPRQPGAIRMTVDARTIQAFDPAQFNVIDVDAYGDPWEIWESLRTRIAGRTAAFLTFGHVHNFRARSSIISNFLKSSCGIPEEWRAVEGKWFPELPSDSNLATFMGAYHFRRSLAGLKVARALVADYPTTSYYGVLFA